MKVKFYKNKGREEERMMKKSDRKRRRRRERKEDYGKNEQRRGKEGYEIQLSGVSGDANRRQGSSRASGRT